MEKRQLRGGGIVYNSLSADTPAEEETLAEAETPVDEETLVDAEPPAESEPPAEEETPVDEETPAEGELPSGVETPADEDTKTVDMEILVAMLDELPEVEDYLAMTADKQTEVKTHMALIYAMLEQLSEAQIAGLDLSRLMALNNSQPEANKVMLLAARAIALSGEGTEESPYLISTAADLLALAEEVNGGNTCADTYFALTKDIELTGEWTPIGTQTTPFAGNFDGAGHTISGLNVNGSDNYQGLFGYLNKATIADLTVNGSISSGGQYIGGIAGYLVSGTITGCTNNVNVNSSFNNSMACVGGIAGYNGGAIVNCSNAGKIAAKFSYVGGIVGQNIGTVEKVKNSGAVSGRNRIGGIAGSSYSIKAASNSGNVTADGQYAGGIVGLCGNNVTIKHVSVQNCVITAADYVGGIAAEGNVSYAFVDNVTLAECVHKDSFVPSGTAADAYTKETADQTDLVSGKLLRDFLTEGETVDSNNYWVETNGVFAIDWENSKPVSTVKFLDQSEGRVAALNFTIDGKAVAQDSIYADNGGSLVYALQGSLLTLEPVAAEGEDIAGFMLSPAVSSNNGIFSITVAEDAHYEYGFGNFASETAAERYGWYLNDPSATDFHISTAAEFAGLGDICNGEAVDLSGSPLAAFNFSNKNIYLDEDIDLSTVCGAELGSWDPIAIATKAHVYGGGHVISGLYIDAENSSGTNYYGLFRGSYAIIEDLTVAGEITVNVSGGTAIVAGIASGPSTTLTRCVNRVNFKVEATGGKACVGGVAYAASSTAYPIDSCLNLGDFQVTALGGTVDVGGICYMASTMFGGCTLKDCLNLGDLVVTEDSTGTVDFGGIVGNTSTVAYFQLADNNVFAGTVTKPDSVVGDFAPIIRKSNANGVGQNCYYLEGSPSSNAAYPGTALSAADMSSPYIVGQLDGGRGLWGIDNGLPGFVYMEGVQPVKTLSVKNLSSDVYSLAFSSDDSGVQVDYRNGVVSMMPGTLKLTVTPADGFKIYNNAVEVLPESPGVYKIAVGADSGAMMLECGTAEAVEAGVNSSANLGWYTDHISDTVYKIGTAAELQSLAALVNGTASGYDAASLSGKTVQLTADIDLSAYDNWQPIGSADKPFAGNVDGNGYSVTGLKVNNPEADYQGLFGYVGGNIENITVSGSVSGHDYVGTLAGYVGGVADNNKIINAAVSGNNYVGGLAGLVMKASEGDSVLAGTVTATGDYVGGIFGQSSYSSTSGNGLEKSYVGDVAISGNNYVGGLIGNAVASAYNCYSLAGVTAKAEGAAVGGLFGSVKRAYGCFYYKEGANLAAIGQSTESDTAQYIVAVYYLTADGQNLSAGLGEAKTAAVFAGREIAWELDCAKGSHAAVWQMGGLYPVFGQDSVDEEGNVVPYDGKNSVYRVTLAQYGDVRMDAAGTSLAVNTDEENKIQTTYMVAGEQLKLTYAAPADKAEYKPYFEPVGVCAENIDGTYTVTVTDSDCDIAYSLCKEAESDIIWYTKDVNADVFVISNLKELWGFAKLVNGMIPGRSAVNFAGKTIKLADNLADDKIVVPAPSEGEEAWSGIGLSSDGAFRGVFDGNNKTIGYTVNATASDNYKGLFNYLGEGAVVKNLTVEGTVSAGNYVGGIAGYAFKNVVVENCTNKVSINAGTTSVGGIVGYIEDGVTVKDCTNYTDFTKKAGGIIGSASIKDAEAKTMITGCRNYGDITGSGILLECKTVSSSSNCILTLIDCENYGNITGSGGIIGSLGSYATALALENCQNHGDVTNTSTRTGGIIGSVNGLTATGLVNTGKVESTKGQVGGLFGYVASGKVDVYKSYNTGTVIGVTASSSSNGVGGLLGSFNYLGGDKTFTDCYNAGEVIDKGTSTYAQAGGIYGGTVPRAAGQLLTYNCFNYGRISAPNQANANKIGALSVPASYFISTNTYYLDKAENYANKNGSVTVSDISRGIIPMTEDDFCSYLAAMKLNGDRETAAFTYNIGDDYPTLAADAFDITGPALIIQEGKNDGMAGGTVRYGSSDAAFAYPGVGTEVAITVTPDEGKAVKSYSLADTEGNAYPFKLAEAGGALTLSFSMPSKDIVVSADFTDTVNAEDEVTVTFDANGGKWGGDETREITFPAGSRLQGNALMPESPVKDGEGFMGWYTDEACTAAYNMSELLVDDITLYAKFADACTVTFNFTGGTMQTTDGDHNDTATVVVAKGDTMTAPAIDPERSGYSFFGWFADAERMHSFDFSKPITADVTVYANFVMDGNVQVTFDLRGGTYNGAEVYRAELKSGEQLVEPDVAGLSHPDGYPFGGWYTEPIADNGKWDFADPVSGNMILYAHWVGDDFEINNGGSKEEPYVIETIEQLLALKDAVNSGNRFVQQYFKLGADLTLPAGWTGIGDVQPVTGKPEVGHYFAGVFDGDGHTLTFQEGSAPLFNYIGGFDVWISSDRENMCTVKNLQLLGDFNGSALAMTAEDTLLVENVTLLSGSSTTASGLVDNLEEASLTYTRYFIFDNCTIEPGVTVGIPTANCVGGICGGYGDRAHFTNCVSYADIVGNSYVGGILGSNGDHAGVINNCYVGGSVTGNTYVGGLMGHGGNGDMSAYAYNGIDITDSWSDAAVKGNDYVGGLAGSVSSRSFMTTGSNTSPKILNSYFNGTVESSGVFVGQIAGCFVFNKPKAGDAPYTYSNSKNSFYTPQGIDAVAWDIQGGTAADLAWIESDHFMQATPEQYASGYVAYMLDGNDGVHNNVWTQGDGIPVLTARSGGASVYQAEYVIEGEGSAIVSMRGIAESAKADPKVYCTAGSDVSLDIQTEEFAEPLVSDEGTTYYVYQVEEIAIDYTQLSYDEEGELLEVPVHEDISFDTVSDTSFAAAFPMPEANVTVKIKLAENEIFVPNDIQDEDPNAGNRNDENHRPANGNGSGSGTGTGIGGGAGTSVGDNTGSRDGAGQGSGTGAGIGSGNGVGSVITNPGGGNVDNPSVIPVAATPDRRQEASAQVITQVDDMTDTPEADNSTEVNEPAPDVAPEGGSEGGNEGGDNGEEEEVHMSFFEVVRNTLQENPLITALMVLIILAIIAVAGYNRYRRSKNAR